MSRAALCLIVTVAILLVPGIAFAHPGHSVDGGLLAGFLHPFSGIDHLLAMTAVGLLAAHLGGRALWAVPVAFVAVMVLGGVCGFAGVSLPFVETAIALSVLVFGVAIFMSMPLPVFAAMAKTFNDPPTAVLFKGRPRVRIPFAPPYQHILRSCSPLSMSTMRWTPKGPRHDRRLWYRR